MSQGNKLYVGNLPYSISEQDLASLFAQCGEVTSVKIITDRETGRSKGFAFVEMATGEQAAAAIEKFNSYNFNGRPLNVNEARPQQPREGGFGGGGGGGYGDRGSRGGWGNRGGSRY